MSSSPVPVTNFMRQQGFGEEPAGACDMHFQALYFQPRIVFPSVLLAIVLQLVSLPLSAALHLVICAVLCWNVALPAANPFERAYDVWIARPRGRRPLEPAPAPRRFAQAMAAAFNLVAALALLTGHLVLARVMQAFLVVAFSALLFGPFCLGAYLFHLLRGRAAFANATLPWARR